VEWLVAEMGTILAGGMAAGVYTTNLPEVSTMWQFALLQHMTTRSVPRLV
jgi:hypothetical protein